MEGQEVSLATLGDGAAIERFDLALQEVLDNIQDINTDPKKAREVVMKVKISPDQDRAVGKVSVEVVTKIAPVIPFGTHVFMGKNASGRGIACEVDPKQGGIFDPPKAIATENVKVFKTAQEAAQ